MVTIKPALVLSVKQTGLNIRLGEVDTHVDEEYSGDIYWWGDKLTLEMAYRQTHSWSFPLDLKNLAPRKGVSVMSDVPCSPLPVVVCSVDHTVTTYVSVARNTSPQIYLSNYSEFEFIVSERLPPTLTVSEVTVDGDKTLLLRPFRSCYFDPFSTTDKLFIQNINENDFVPQLSFAFYKRSSSDTTTTITSHKVNLTDSRSSTDDIADHRHLRIIRIDDDNKVAISVATDDNLVTVSIMSEFMVESARTRHISRHQGATGDTPVAYSLSLGRVDLMVFTEGNTLATQIRLSNVLCELRPDRSVESVDATLRQSLTFRIEDIQIDNSLRDQTYDYSVVMFTDKAVRTSVTNPGPFLKTTVTFNNSEKKHSIHEFNFEMSKIHVHLEDLFLYQLADVLSQYISRVQPRAPRNRHVKTEALPSNVLPSEMPAVVRTLMSELYEPLSVELFSISDIDIELGVHASIKLFLAADKIPLKFKRFKVRKLFTLAEHFSQVILAKYVGDIILQAGWALASLDLLGSPGLMIRSTLSGVRDLIVLPYLGLTRGPSAFVSGIAAGSASLARNIGTGVITSVTNLAVSISRNMDRMSLDEGHTTLCAIHRRSYKASHVGSGLSKGLTGLGLHLLSAVAGLVHLPIQDIGASEGIVGATKGLVTGVSKGLVGMVTKPLGGAAELVANTGEGLLTGAGWILAPQSLVPEVKQLLRSDTRIRVALELLQMSSTDVTHVVQCAVTPISIYLVVSPDKIYLLLDSIIQCFKRDSVRHLFNKSTVAIYFDSPLDKESDTTKLDKTLLEKINKMYSVPCQDSQSESSSDLIATLPLVYPRNVLLRNLLT